MLNFGAVYVTKRAMKNRFTSCKPIDQTRVVVAMSGGVDSSVVAAMLHDEGYEVIGVTMQLYDHGVALEKKGACCAGKDIYDAKRVAQQLGFKHYVLDYESVFKQEVMDDFADSYLRGQTPIPCVKCNQSVKFRDLFKMAKDLGADALATGHYVQRIDNNGNIELHRGADTSKDQSYFLFATTKEQLEYVHFPLGGMDKAQTRQLALKYHLEVADKPDSQDICFVPEGGYASVIAKMRPGALDPGKIVHIDGRILGDHEGIIHFTRGQRRGLGVAVGEPLYVVDINPDTKEVVVGPESALGQTDVMVQDVNWLGAEDALIASEGVSVKVKLRSATMPVDAIFRANDRKGGVVILHTPDKAVAPGQACVMYDGSRVLGGGWIA